MALKRSSVKKPVAYRWPVGLNASVGRSKKNRCVLCGRTGAEALLNIDGTVHHGAKIECLDRQSCNRRRRKQRKGNG